MERAEEYISWIRKRVGHDPVMISGAAVILYRDHQILLQRRSDDGLWCTHGGCMEPGESLIQALKREVREEIGMQIGSCELYGIFSGEQMYHKYPNQDQIYCISHMFFCTDFSGEPMPDEDEVTALKWFDIDCLPAMEEISHLDAVAIARLPEFLKDHKPIIA